MSKTSTLEQELEAARAMRKKIDSLAAEKGGLRSVPVHERQRYVAQLDRVVRRMRAPDQLHQEDLGLFRGADRLLWEAWRKFI